MRKLSAYQKLIIMSIPATILLVVVGLHFSTAQQQEPNEVTDQVLDTNQIYENGIRSMVWIIRPDGGWGSGVLINKKFRLVVTNSHVVKDNPSVEVIFASRNRNGKLINENAFYRNEHNLEVLKEFGYVTTGRVIAKGSDSNMDLAIIEIAGIPETAKKIDYADPDFPHIKKEEDVHVFGNPEDRPLWRRNIGKFQEDMGKELEIAIDAWYGDSGGPILNKYGKLIGITKKSNLEDRMWAVPLKDILTLKSKLGSRLVFVIRNATGFAVDYEVKWTENGPWEKSEIVPLGPPDASGIIHWWPGEPLKEDVNPSPGYPKIRFDEINDDKENFGTDYQLKTNIRRFGDLEDKSGIAADASQYYFSYDSKENKFHLHEGVPSVLRNQLQSKSSIGWIVRFWQSLKNPIFWIFLVVIAVPELILLNKIDRSLPKKRHIFSIKNDTRFPIDFKVKWTKHEDWPENENHLESGALWTDWKSEKKRPQVRFNDGKEIQELTLKTHSRRFGRHADNRVSREDGRKYHFEYSGKTKVLNLCDSE